MALPTICILLLAITAIGTQTHAKRQKKEETLSLREIEKWFQKEFDEMVATCDQRMKDIEALAKCEKCPNPITKEDLAEYCKAQAVSTPAPATTALPPDQCECKCPQQVSTEQPETGDCIPKEELAERCKAQEVSTAEPVTTALPCTRNVFRDCQDALEQGKTASGVYIITTEECNAIAVYCDQEIDGGGWVVFQQRKDGSVDFFRTWDSYREGFGNPMGNMWLGNKYIHLLTRQRNTELKVELTSMEGEVEYADYSSFSIEDEANNFRLHVSGYTGGRVPGNSLYHHRGQSFSTLDADNDSDSLSSHNGHQFSTRDEDNDSRSSLSCASLHHGAWWYGYCGAYSNLNGQYEGSGATGVYWRHWKGLTSLRGTRMMMRRRT